MSAAPVQNGSGAMFDAIADRYDLVNRVISLGVDQSWRKKTVRALNLGEGAKVLDLATGTADLALMIADKVESAKVVGLDPSGAMLAVGQRKIDKKGLAERISLVQGDAEALPFPSRSFDGVSIAFGIRNVPNRGRALREMARVTRPGGRIAILELSEPRKGPLASLARFHVHTLVPHVGAFLSRAPEYRYLERSIAAFPAAEEFGALMQESGLNVLEIVPLTFGVCHLYVAEPQGVA
jgi:demethylmenaquinone methyltransferase / 2-methoxy-6-polyprenyl-1,4-benzoquinol methylase